MLDFVSHFLYNSSMDNEFLSTVELVKDYNAYTRQLKSFAWGTIEVREKGELKYVYVHKRDGGIPRTEYAGEYSEELINELIANNKKAKEIKTNLRAVSAKLKRKGHVVSELSDKVKLNIDFAKRNLVDTIYNQAILEGVAVTFLDTETIVDGGKATGISVDDIQKINNLKHAWQFALDEGVITSPSNFDILCYINKLVEEGFYYNAGTLRSVPVSIGGTSWKPELPIEGVVREKLQEILSAEDVCERAINAMLFIMRRQLFIDGNKRTAVIFANHVLISNGFGIVVVPENKVNEYKKLLIDYYESDDKDKIVKFLYEHCLTKI